MSKMSASVLGGATLLLATAVAEADENCKVEDWRWYIPHGDTLAIEGASNCKDGRIVIRVYAKEGDEERFLGIADAYLDGYAFEAYVDKIDKPNDITIRYSIEPEG